MPPAQPEQEMAEPVLRKSRGFSLVWIVPIVAAAIGIWLAVTTVMSKGPLVDVTFITADGLEAGKTKVKYRDVDVGLVEAVHVTPDLTRVVVEARMEKSFAANVTEDSRFWVVRPRVGVSGVTGLGTLLSGAYIEVEPAEGDPASSFVGLEEPPLIRSDVKGTQYTLIAENLGSSIAGPPSTSVAWRWGRFSVIDCPKTPAGSRFRSSCAARTISWCAMTANSGTSAASRFEPVPTASTCRSPALRHWSPAASRSRRRAARTTAPRPRPASRSTPPRPASARRESTNELPTSSISTVDPRAAGGRAGGVPGHPHRLGRAHRADPRLHHGRRRSASTSILSRSVSPTAMWPTRSRSSMSGPRIWCRSGSGRSSRREIS